MESGRGRGRHLIAHVGAHIGAACFLMGPGSVRDEPIAHTVTGMGKESRPTWTPRTQERQAVRSRGPGFAVSCGRGKEPGRYP
jgi:hypothetical protein